MIQMPNRKERKEEKGNHKVATSELDQSAPSPKRSELPTIPRMVTDGEEDAARSVRSGRTGVAASRESADQCNKIRLSGDAVNGYKKGRNHKVSIPAR